MGKAADAQIIYGWRVESGNDGEHSEEQEALYGELYMQVECGGSRDSSQYYVGVITHIVTWRDSQNLATGDGKLTDSGKDLSPKHYEAAKKFGCKGEPSYWLVAWYG